MQKGVYRHFKGSYYQVLDQAIHSETDEIYVVYRALYGECQLFVRPQAMFEEMVERDGQTLPRFVYVGGELPEMGREVIAESGTDTGSGNAD